MEIRKSSPQDESAIWEIFRKVIATGDTYVFAPDSGIEIFLEHWICYEPMVAVQDAEVVGTYIVKPNQLALGSHVANGSYMVHPDHQGKEIGKEMGLHSLDHARILGFKAMQFNHVVSTNQAAVKLWKKIGFRIVGTTPKAFDHSQLGLVDTHIMYREL